MFKTFVVAVMLVMSFSVGAVQVEAYKDGEMKGVFLGSSAGFDSVMSVIINGIEESPYQVMPNHQVPLGDTRIFGNVEVGDTIVFKLEVLTTGKTWYSDPTMNIDGKDHVHIVNISGGVYVGFEDIYGLGDRDFNDHMVAFSNVHMVPEVPEPEMYLMFLLGLGLIYASSTRKSKVTKI